MPIEQILSSNLTLVGVLAVAVFALWQLTSHYHKKSMEDAAAARKAVEASHEETKQLLREQNAKLQDRNDLLVERVKDEQIARQKEMKEHHDNINRITDDYKEAIGSFKISMQSTTSILSDIKDTITDQTHILKSISALPSQMDELQSAVEILQDDVAALKNIKEAPKNG